MANSITGLCIAFFLGIIIGLERQYRQQSAGLRTHVLVTLGAAIFVCLAKNIDGYEGAIRVIAYVVSGIGFIGAGVIMRQDGGIQGLNTSATIWCSGGVGAAAGANMYLIAIFSVLLILVINIFLRPVVNYMDRRPANDSSEIKHNVNIITHISNCKETIKIVRATLNEENIPMMGLKVDNFGDNEILIKATLNVTSITSQEMNTILDKLNKNSGIDYAFCSLT